MGGGAASADRDAFDRSGQKSRSAAVSRRIVCAIVWVAAQAADPDLTRLRLDLRLVKEPLVPCNWEGVT